jgi:dsDNA-specific endonuclease/ATPase MutS2
METRMAIQNFKLTQLQLKQVLELHDSLMGGKQTLWDEMIELKRLLARNSEEQISLNESHLKKLIFTLKRGLESEPLKAQAELLKNEIFEQRENIFNNVHSPIPTQPNLLHSLTPIDEDRSAGFTLNPKP